ncbi:hypothetical protein CLV59_1074 [Chitinophaga dinghuensis]|uniref:Uncharacterized protein n=1 Tax=Chitinophaga dinghuensis TaxID=1539050 RepID=A0A327VT80_9BACT|nr:hypothetical protein [Chitinophaga dinghuensis]RAJ77239.1 hypothetical protein CLV59_1074 [Chitinophaga dinghuensis]
MIEQNNPIRFKVSIPLTPYYKNRYVHIIPTEAEIEIQLIDGSHIVHTDLKNVGALAFFRDPQLQARLTFWYDFDSKSNTITLCSNNLQSSDSTFISTVPRGSNQFCHQHTYAGDNTPCGTNPNWNYCTPLTPGLKEAIHETVIRANNIIIEKAKSMDYTVILRTPPPKISLEEYEKYSAVYQNGEFKELFNPEKEYDDTYSILSLDSTWYGEIYLKKNDNFSNVIGSTDDPKIASKTWIKLWEGQFGKPDDCSSLNYNGYKCSGGLVGGHVILGKTASAMPKGSNKVFIMPICTQHNNDDNTYMAPIKYSKGIALHNYLNK